MRTLAIWVQNNLGVDVLVDGVLLKADATRSLVKEIDTIASVDFSVVKSNVDEALSKLDVKEAQLQADRAKLLALK